MSQLFSGLFGGGFNPGRFASAGLLAPAMNFIPGLGDFLQFGLLGESIAQQREAEEAAREATEARFEQGLGELTGLREDQRAAGQQILQGAERRFGQQRADLRDLQSSLNLASAQGTQRNLRDLGAFERNLLGRLSSDLAANQAAFGQFADPLLQGFQSREQRVLSELEGLGAQERRDINRQFDELSASQTQDLARRGLGSSTITSTVQQGAERERADAVGRLEDRLRRQRVGTLADITGQTLGAQERLGAAGFDIGRQGRSAITGAAGDIGQQRFNLLSGSRLQDLARNQQLGLAGVNLRGQHDAALMGLLENNLNREARLTGGIVDLLGSRQDIPPNQNQLIQSLMGLGRFAADLPDQPSTGEQLIGPSIGAAGSIISAKILMLCIHDLSVITTSKGPMPLVEVNVNDRVMGLDGKFHRVLAKDCGEPHPERRYDYMRIETKNRAIILTRDHVIEKKRADQYRTGEKIPTVSGPVYIHKIEFVDPVPSGDLLLEGSDGYIANGFPVKSGMDWNGKEEEIDEQTRKVSEPV